MKSSTKSMILSMLCIVILALFSFSKLEKNPAKFDLEDIDIIDLLTEQKYECRPSESYMFWVDSKVFKETKEANSVNVKIYICDRNSSEKELLAEENIKLEHYHNLKTMSTASREILASASKKSNIYNIHKTPYGFYELMKFESIHRSYLISKLK